LRLFPRVSEQRFIAPHSLTSTANKNESMNWFIHIL
jgi:hypothetical protein